MRNVGQIASPAEIKEDYFRWLCGLVQADDPDHSFFLLAAIMHDMTFYVMVKNDDNRAIDGLKLHYEFERQAPLYLGVDILDALTEPCSILEMMIALAGRMEEVMYDAEEEDSTYRWFWEMVENLGLGDFDDAFMLDRDDFSRDKVVDILHRFVIREYRSNGVGGLFPLKNPGEDQRDVEIWYQMQAYLDENYPI